MILCRCRLFRLQDKKMQPGVKTQLLNLWDTCWYPQGFSEAVSAQHYQREPKWHFTRNFWKFCLCGSKEKLKMRITEWKIIASRAWNKSLCWEKELYLKNMSRILLISMDNLQRQDGDGLWYVHSWLASLLPNFLLIYSYCGYWKN